MFQTNTATVLTALFFTLAAFAPAQPVTSSSLTSTSAGLRIQLDSEGKRVQGSLDSPSYTTRQLPDAAALQVSPAASLKPQVVSSRPGNGTVVRLNGLFRAGSRVIIGSDGKLQGECHIEDGAGRAGGQH